MARHLEPRLSLAGLLLAVATLLLPSTLLGSWGADLRLAPVAVSVLLLALRPTSPRVERVVVALGLLLFLARVAWITALWTGEDAVLSRRLALLDHVPRASRMGFVAVQTRCGTPWTLTPDRKLGSYAMTRRDAFTNTMFQIGGADLVTIRSPADAPWHDRSQDVPARCPSGDTDLAVLGAKLARMRGFDTVWIAGAPGLAPPAGWRVLRRDGGDLLIGR